MSSSRPAPVTAGRGLGWRPGLGTVACLAIAMAVTAYLFSPPWWGEMGFDAKDLYAAGVVRAAGGDPYQISQQAAAETRLFTPDAAHPYAPSPYGNPPAFTALLALASRLNYVAFFVASMVVLVAAGLAGLEFLLDLSGWQQRTLPRLFFLVTIPMAVDAFVGNPSALMLLALGAGVWLVARGRPLLGGIALAGLAIKPQVGLPLAVVAVATAPMAAREVGRRVRASAWATVGVVLGLAAFGGVGVLLEGTRSTAQWWAGLTEYAGALGPQAQSSAFTQSGLAGLPALLEDRLWPPLAVAVVALAVIPVAGFALWRRRAELRQSTLLPLALGIACALALSPYLHLNDLVLAALPLLLVAAQRLGVVPRLTLLAWTIGSPARLVLLTILAPVVAVNGPSRAGFGVLLIGVLLFAVLWGAIRYGPGQANKIVL
ncbi:MAG: glycosyltransferase family 87 protein [Candidatus Dormibacteria bacterium]